MDHTDIPLSPSALLEKIRAALADRRLARVAAETGLHENTLRAIANGKNQNPSLETVAKLVAYLKV